MDDVQVEKIIQAMNALGDRLAGMASQKYTITGAADWELLVVLGTAFFGLIVFVWRDLRTTIKDNRSEWQQALTKAEDQLWDEARVIRKEMKECKDRCLDRPARQGG